MSRRTARWCERRVGYDRFAGEAAYRQLTELYRALRLYVNCFQASMKLQSKVRQGSHVHRTYDQAQTPLQRLLATGVLAEAKVEELQRVARVLDPMRLLAQLPRVAQRGVSKQAMLDESASQVNSVSSFAC